MTSVFAVTRGELRRRFAALVVLGVIAGLTGAVVVGALTLARRTATAYDRLEQASNADDVRGQILGRDAAETGQLGERLAAVPGVTNARTSPIGVARLVGDEVVYLGVMAAAEDPDDPLQPVLIEGRMPDDDAPGEVVVVDSAARSGDVSVGDRGTMRALTRDEFYAFSAEEPLEGLGPEVEMEIVGVVRIPGRADDLVPFIAGPALMEQVPDFFDAGSVFLAQVEDAGVAGDAIDEAAQIAEEVPLPPEASEFRAAGIDSVESARTAAANTTGAIVVGLLGFAGVALFAGGIALAQAAARQQALTADEQRVEAALGMTRSQRVLARALAALLPGAIAIAFTLAGGLIAAALEPLGGVRYFEPNPDWSPNLAVLAIGLVLVAAITVAVTAVAAMRTRVSTDVDRDTVREASIASRMAQVGGSPPVVVGLRFGFERGSGRSAVPVRSSLAAVIFGVAGVASVLVFIASLDRLVGEPLRFGYMTELSIVDGGEPEVERAVADDRTDVVFHAKVSDLDVDGHTYTALGLEERKGEVEWELLSGRPAATPDEIVLGTRVSDELDKSTGDVVTVDTGDGERSLAVVGVGVLPRFDTSQVGRNVAVTYEALDDLSSVDSFGEVGISPAPGTSADELAGELAGDYELNVVELPEDVQNLDDLNGIPQALGAFLGLLAAIALAHSILVASRRRRHDVAMLRVLGFTPGQTSVSFATSATAIGIVGAVIGLPLGIALGATVWRWVAEDAGVAADALVPAIALAAIVVGAVVVALVLVAFPAWRSGRERPATALRTE